MRLLSAVEGSIGYGTPWARQSKPLFPAVLSHQVPPRRAWLNPFGTSLQILADTDEVLSQLSHLRLSRPSFLIHFSKERCFSPYRVPAVTVQRFVIALSDYALWGGRGGGAP